jgi:hypothetical protein
MKLEFPRRIFKKYSNMNFHENPSRGSGVVSRGRMDGRTGVTTLTLAFRNFSNAPKKIKQAFSKRHNIIITGEETENLML